MKIAISKFTGLALAATLACQANAATITQAGDPGVSQGGATPNSNAAAAAFDAANTPSFIETFEDVDADGFTFSAGTITNAPLGAGGAVWGFNTTPGGQYVLELVGQASTFTFTNAVSAFGFYLSGVQLSNLTVNFVDGGAQSISINNYGDGVQFFGASGFSSAVSGFSIGNTNDVIGVDDLRFTAANTAVPEPGVWALMIVGFFGMGAMLRRAKARQPLAFA
jgi:hypothetical protein